MRIATVHQRASLIAGAGAVDIHEASGGRFGPGAADLDERRAGFVDWAAAANAARPRAVRAGLPRLAIADAAAGIRHRPEPRRAGLALAAS